MSFAIFAVNNSAHVSHKVRPVSGKLSIGGSAALGPREALADTVDKYVLQLHDIESSTEKARQEKRDLLKQMDALRMAVEQLKIYRLVRLAPAASQSVRASRRTLKARAA